MKRIINLTDLAHKASLQGITIWLACDSTKARMGIHLFAPTEHELLDALATAERDGYADIWIHDGLAKETNHEPNHHPQGRSSA